MGTYCEVLGAQGVESGQVAPHGGGVELLHLLGQLLLEPTLLLILLCVGKLHHDRRRATLWREGERERWGEGEMGREGERGEREREMERERAKEREGEGGRKGKRWRERGRKRKTEREGRGGREGVEGQR